MAQIFGIEVEESIKTKDQLRSFIAPPNKRVADKVIDYVDELACKFIAASPFIVLSSHRQDGHLDLSPRGDPAGFVKVLNQKTLIIPDRTGNRRMDTFENILTDPHVGLFFLIPGNKDTLRISGKAALVRDKSLAKQFTEQGSVPQMLMLIHVERVLSHCPKCILRSGLWDKDKDKDLSQIPSLAEMMVKHSKLSMSIEEMQMIIDRDAKTRVYSTEQEYFGYVNLDIKK
tara:strand:- start:213 stop:902 length:690 start_codon:yes stop_codon:yes gene_type:complete